MRDSMLQSVLCPNCGTPIDLRRQNTDGTNVQCDACGGQFILRGHVCPRCGTYHAQEVAFCRQCGMSLNRRCPQCNTVNWIGDEFCVNCGAALDILEVIVQRHNLSTQGRLYQQMEEARQIKDAEQAAAETRMARMMEQERQRQREIQRRFLKQKEQEKKLLRNVIIASVVIILLIIIVSIIGAL